VNNSRSFRIHGHSFPSRCASPLSGGERSQQEHHADASSLIGLFLILDLAVMLSHYASILTLYERYSTPMDQAKKGAYIAAVHYASAMLTP
jgi:hypothetical protein